MLTRRDFLQRGLVAAGALSAPLAAAARASSTATDIEPPPDLFDAQALDIDFWLRPRTLSVTRPASGERAKVLYWKDGEIIDSAYQELCHLMRDVNGRETAPIDPKLFETLWGAQAFIARYGMLQPLEILSGYRTAKSNARLIEQGIPAARQSLHLDGKAADIRIASLNPEVLGGLVKSFRTGGVGFYYRNSSQGGWIHADTGVKRSWKG
ncbi:MAG: YcbK family protein [Telluria sp.]